MNKIGFLPVVATMLVLPSGSSGQTQFDLRTQSKNVDFSSALSTRPFKTGAALPPACVVGEAFFKTNATAGQNWYGCTSSNNWVQQSGSSLNDYTVVTFSSTPTFTVPGNHVTTFLLLVTGDVNSSSLSNPSAGDSLTFRICQDGTGGHAFAWPATVHDGGPVDQTAGACTTQSFVFDGTVAQAISPATTTGISGSAIALPGSSSGATTIQPSAVAGGTLTLPARTATLATTAGTSTPNNCAKFDASGNLVDSGGTCAAGGSVSQSSSAGQHQWFAAATCGYGGPYAAGIDEDSSAPNVLVCGYVLDGVGPHVGLMEFQPNADGYAWVVLQLPASFSNVNMSLWAWRGGGTGDTRYVLDGGCIAAGAANVTYTSTASVIGLQAGQVWQSFVVSSFPTTGCSGGNLLVIKVHRDHLCSGCTNGNMTDISYLRGIEVDIQ